MRHVIVGASGQVGGALMRHLNRVGEEVIGTYLSHALPGLVPLNLESRDHMFEALRDWAPDVVWLPAALPNVDLCEREPEKSYAVNVEGPRLLASLDIGKPFRLVFISTDYVFDGEDGPYRESDATHPLQVYGQHKVLAEEYVLARPEAVVIRPAWIYSGEPNPRNFVFRTVEMLRGGDTVRAAIDQFNTPTPAGPLARVSWEAVGEGFSGILHAVGPERLSRYDLTRRIAQWAGISDAHIEPIRAAELDLPAKRPLSGGLVTEHEAYHIHERLEDLPFA